MEFILGIIVGILVAILIVCVLAYFKKPIIQTLGTIEKQVAIKAPRARGFIISPSDEATEAREAIIQKNREEGKDTKIAELQ